MTSSPRARLSPRHTKGVLTLALFVLAESVTFSNAVSFWSKFQKVDGDRFFSQEQQESTKSSSFFARKESSQDCSASIPAAQGISNKFSLFSRTRPTTRRAVIQSSAINDAEFCARDCSHCPHVDASAAVARMSRGGHSHAVHDTATAAAAAVMQTTPYNIPLHVWKILFQIMLTALNVACWLIPLKSKRISENKLGLSLANAFSGGVFLSLAFGHLIPECLHGFDSTYSEATPFMFVLAGYLLIFFVEKVAFDAHDILHEMEANNGAAPISASAHAGHNHKAVSNKKADAKADANGGGATAGSSGRSAVILLGALAVHSILEMMALGLADTFGDCALLTLSISLHQPAESIALLVAFLKSGLSHSQIIRFLSIFSCMGPVGVLLGMLVNEYAAPIVDSIMLAIVAGTFVYVGATEVIPEEWEDSEHKWKKFAALMSGIISIFAITQYTMTLGH